jgi:hypothetical protein
MTRRPAFAIASATVLALTAAAGAGPRATADDEDVLRTPGDAAYCSSTFTRQIWSGFTCFRPADGFYIRLRQVQRLTPIIEKGRDPRYRGYRNARVALLGFGKSWVSSDAEIVSCRSAASGLTCEHHSGLSFWLGPGGYRIFLQAPGRPPSVRPLLRTVDGIYCGIDRTTLEPAVPVLLCWNAHDGTVVSIRHGQLRGTYQRSEKARGFRPSGFPQLPAGASVSWRCRSVAGGLAEECSKTSGRPVFTCARGPGGVTCKNLRGHGLTISRLSFYVF